MEMRMRHALAPYAILDNVRPGELLTYQTGKPLFHLTEFPFQSRGDVGIAAVVLLGDEKDMARRHEAYPHIDKEVLRLAEDIVKDALPVAKHAACFRVHTLL